MTDKILLKCAIVSSFRWDFVVEIWNINYNLKNVQTLTVAPQYQFHLWYAPRKRGVYNSYLMSHTPSPPELTMNIELLLCAQFCAINLKFMQEIMWNL